MKTRLLLFSGLAGFLLLTGCDTIPGQSGSDMDMLAIFRPEVAKITPDDPLPIFRKVFPARGYPAAKDPLDTTAEYRARLAKLQVTGTYVFLIPPEECTIDPFPDNNTYFVVSKDSFIDGDDEENNPTLPYGVTVATIDQGQTTYDRTTKYGGQVQVTYYDDLRYQLWLTNLLQLPQALRWKLNEYPDVHFGLGFRTDDPGFRQLLRDKKIGLAVRVRIDDISAVTSKTRYSGEATTHFKTTRSLLPATLLEAWIVDTSTMMSVAHWTESPGQAK